MNIYRKIFFTINILLSSIFFSNIVYGKYIFNEELQAYDLTVRNLETNIRNFTIQNDEGLNYKILDGDKVVAENEVINSNDFEFDKEYKIEIYNNTKNVYILDINTEGTEINTFSKYVTIDVSADANNSCNSVIYTGNRLVATNKKIIRVDSFIPSNTPLIYYFTISTKYVKMNLEQYPERIENDSNLNLNFIISATLPSWNISATEEDNVTATLYGNTLKITGTGNMIDFTSSTIPWKDYQFTITEIEVKKGVTNIGDRICYNFNYLNTVKLPNTLNHIGKFAFYNTIIENIDIPEGVISLDRGAFWKCTKLKNIKLPNTLKEIESNCFQGCNFTNIVIPEGVIAINGHQVFTNCSSLESITLPSTLEILGDKDDNYLGLFDGCINLKEVIGFENTKLDYIDNFLFSNCTSLKNITIPSGIIEIGENAFYNCISLINITIPKSVTEIGENAFYNWTSEQTIYCDFYSQPDTWNNNWNYYCNANIVWTENDTFNMSIKDIETNILEKNIEIE